MYKQRNSILARGLSLLGVFLLLLGIAGLQTQTALAAELVVDRADPACNDSTGPVYCTIQPALNAAAAGDTIKVAAGTYPLSAVLNLNKENITLLGVGSPLIQVSGSGDRFVVSAQGVTIQGFTIEKTDKTGEQNIIRIAASNTSILDNEIFGKFQIGDGEVSRAMVINAGAFSGLNISGNTIHHLRQPAYISGTHTGTISNNYVYLTKGWVLEGGNLAFSNNTWGTGTNVNVYDIAIISLVPGSYYTDILAMSSANNGAVIEDQRVSPAVLSSVYVDAATSFSSDLGGRYHPYSTIAPALTRVVPGGTIHVAAGSYVEQLNITKSLHLLGAGAGLSTLQAPANLPPASDLASAIVTVKGSGVDAELTGFTVSGPGPTGCGSIRAGIFVRDGANANIHDNTIQDVRDSTFSGCQNGLAIVVGRQASATTGTATIANNLITGYQKGGIVVDNAGSNAALTNNILTGAGTTSVTAQNGIQISRGATATLTGNTVSGNSYFKDGDTTWSWGAAGVLLYQSGAVTFAGGNTITGNDQNLYIQDAGGLTLGAETIGSSSAPAGAGSDIVNFSSLAIDATRVTFKNALDGFAIEDRVWHVIDEAGLGLVTWIPDNVYITPATEDYQAGSIQRGIDAVAAGGKVNIAAGTFTENLLLNKRVALVGSGPATILATAADEGVSLGTIQVLASGISDAEPLLIKDLAVYPSGRAGISIGRFTQPTGTNVSYLALENVDVVGTGLNPCTEQERGLYVDHTSSLMHLAIKGGSFNHLNYGWYFQKAVSNDASTVQYVTVEGTTFNQNTTKGIYVEKLEDAAFTNIIVADNGSDTGFSACSYFQPWQAGVDINLKAGVYQNITFLNPEVTGNGLGAKEGVGLAIKARSDGTTYGSFPATLENVQISGAIVTGNERGIRIGEPGKNNPGPTSIQIHTSYIVGNMRKYTGTDGSPYGGVVNQALARVDAESNWWGSAAAADVAAEVSGDVDYTPWLCSGIDESTAPGFQTSGRTDCSKPVVTGVTVSPSPAALNAFLTVTAVADDSTTGNSNITGAEYSLNGGPYLAMTARDGAFDSPLENVQATFKAVTLGSNKVCVRATDRWDQTSDAVCSSFTTGYVFTTFSQPIDMGAINLAKAGQTIPVKWRLTDATGAPVSDPSSFGGLVVSRSFSCTSSAAADAIETYTVSSGLQYLGDGYWQFNWKTLKVNTGCWSMSVAFAGGTSSPAVLFNFK